MFPGCRFARLPVVACLALGLVSALSARSQAGLVGIADGNILYDINTGTGAATNPRNVGNKVYSIAYSPSGTLYGVSHGFPSDGPPGGMLYTINVTTGAATYVATLNTFVVVEGDIAFDPTSGTLYAVDGAGQLFTINTTSGAGTVIGTVGSNLDLSAMTFDSAGNLYIVESFGQNLLKVNKANGAILATLPMGNVEQQIGGLAFDGGGTLYYAGGIPSKLYMVNTGSGAAALVGSIPPSGGIYGTAYIPDPTPAHPGTWGRIKALYR